MLIRDILAGGVGSRLWPLSQESFPKQLLRITGWNSLFQDTLSRLDHKLLSSPMVMTNKRYADDIQSQLKEVNIDDAQIILEPATKGTAPAIALAAFAAMEQDREACLIVLPTDHVVDDMDAFYQHIILAYELAMEDQCVTFGVKPNYAATGYGYIQYGNTLVSDRAYVVDQFVEKPNLEKAQRYLADGNYLWNSGMFVLKANHYLLELERLAPDIFKASEKAFVDSRREHNLCYADEAAYLQSPSNSIDYAVLEKTHKTAVIPLGLTWSDIGTWDSLYDVLQKDEHGNVSQGEAALIDCQNSLCFSQSKPVVAIGLDDVIAVETSDAVLLLKRGESQRVGEIVKKLAQLK